MRIVNIFFVSKYPYSSAEGCALAPLPSPWKFPLKGLCHAICYSRFQKLGCVFTSIELKNYKVMLGIKTAFCYLLSWVARMGVD